MKCNYNEESLVSIIMPAYNAENYIEEAVNSVLEQTYKRWELIIIDDGSSDNTLIKLEDFSKKHENVQVLSNESNIGVSATRNRGISIASGKWIAFLDSDDKWDKTKLHKQMKIVEETGAEFVFTGSSYINESGDSLKGIFEVPTKVNYSNLKKHNVISCSSVLINKRFFERIKMENDKMHEDFAVWLRVLSTGIEAYGINEPLLIYRISRNSKSGNKLKTIKMTYKVYRFIGINRIFSILYMTSHVLNSLKKYRNIRY